MNQLGMIHIIFTMSHARIAIPSFFNGYYLKDTVPRTEKLQVTSASNYCCSLSLIGRFWIKVTLQTILVSSSEYGAVTVATVFRKLERTGEKYFNLEPVWQGSSGRNTSTMADQPLPSPRFDFTIPE